MVVRRILFPLDLSSELCAEIVPQVISVAERFASEVHLVSAVEAHRSSSDLYVPDPSLEVFEREVIERAERALREFDEELFASYRRVKRAVLRGYPGEEILRYIGSAAIDLVILATHRRMGLEKVLFGSIADEVIRKSPVPVMSINPREGRLGWRVSNIRPEDELKLRPRWRHP